VAGLGLLGGAYLFGRLDAPGKDDAATESLLNGFRAYRDRVDSVLKEKAKETQRKQIALRQAAKEEARADSIHRTREPLPIPTDEQAEACGGWIRNLERCDEEQLALKNSLQQTRGALETTTRLQLLAEDRGKADSARADSALQQLDRLQDQNEILGIKLPSRKASFAAGAATGVTVSAILCLVFCPR
jgi:hypothetical protein